MFEETTATLLCGDLFSHIGRTPAVTEDDLRQAYEASHEMKGSFEEAAGYPSVMVGVMVLGGVQLIMIGILGEYIGKMMWEQKARPSYFVAEHIVKAADRDEPADAAPRPKSDSTSN